MPAPLPDSLTPRLIAVLAALASGAMLLTAFGFQFLGGLEPCHLCILQRWPHGLAFATGLLLLATPRPLWRPLMLLGALIVLVGAGIALYHTGVEQKWWQGPTTCTAQPITGLTTDELFQQIMQAPVVRCDDIPWSLFGLSMAAWNAVASVAIAALWLAAWFRAGTRPAGA